jgi:hypothetical protein
VTKSSRSFDGLLFRARFPFPKLLQELEHGELLRFGFDRHLEPLIVQSSFKSIAVNMPLVSIDRRLPAQSPLTCSGLCC